MGRRMLAAAIIGLTVSATALGAVAIEGQITTTGGLPIEHVLIEVRDGAGDGYSRSDGRFELTVDSLPTELVVSHPRFERLTVEVASAEEPLAIVLRPKQQVFETIAVSARRGDAGFSPVSVATSVISPEESSAPVGRVVELLAQAPSVSENGQGGLFQTYSVRGVARQRILTRVSGMRIVGERRAGVSTSFVDPLLLSGVEVVRGPSSSYYGSGALGGVVELRPRRFDRLTVAAGVDGRGSERHLLAAAGDSRSSWALAWREGDSAETPEGVRLNSGFRQVSGSLLTSWRRGEIDIDLSLLAAAGRDIGKASTDFPERRTDYPRERHLVGGLKLRRAGVWDLELALHPNRLETRVAEEETSDLRNSAFDWSLGWLRRLGGGARGVGRVGVDYFARRGVDARETASGPSVVGPGPEQRTLEGAREDELGLYGAWEWAAGRASIVTGGRLAWQRQSNAGRDWTDDEAATAFAGLVLPVGGGLELVANAGTGLRFPSLSERFFSGTTGRGEVVANRALDPERAINLDAGLRFYGERLFVAGYLFRNAIDDYIERVEVEPERLTFANLSSGLVEGVELEGFFQFGTSASLAFGGHAINGRDGGDRPLADVPADRLFVGGRGGHDRWRWRWRWEQRREKADVGSGEKPIPAADLVSAALGVEIGRGLSLEVAGRNLLDETYFNSADRKVPPAPARSLSMALRWTGSD